MSQAARKLNETHLSQLESGKAKGFARIRTLWWESFLQGIEKLGPMAAIDHLDAFMDSGRSGLLEMAAQYASSKHGNADAAKLAQLQTQVLKSNTGKMFERFVGLAVSYVLHQLDAPVCVLPFVTPLLKHCTGLTRDHFNVQVRLGANTLGTHIDADLFAFNPDEPDREISLISVKSTLKDRFHNVPFWNLIRRAALCRRELPEIRATDPGALQRCRYVAICSDLAKEQPDFGTEAGARNLLQVDAALLDGAYVTALRAKGVAAKGKHLGHDRDAAFFRLSCLVEYWTSGKNE